MATNTDAPTKPSSLFPSAQCRFFYTDPSGDGSRFFSTETERDVAMKEAIAAWCDEGWGEEVEQIFSGVVTHTVEQCDVQKKPQPCAAHPDHDYGDNDCEACIAFDEYPNHEFDEVCNYKPVTLLAASDVQAEPVRMDERAAFEHWCKTHCGLCDRDLHQTIAGAYRSGYVDDMWDGWSARAGLAASSAKAREVGSC